MIKNSAFTLLELVLALMLCSLSSVVMFGFLATTGTWAYASLRLCHQELSTAIALDTMTRDLMSATQNLNNWDIEYGVFIRENINEQGVLKKIWVGWDCAKEYGLRRKEGDYDRIKHCWKKSTTSIVGCPISRISYKPIVIRNFEDKSIGSVIKVQINYQVGTYQNESIGVRLCNRKLL